MRERGGGGGGGQGGAGGRGGVSPLHYKTFQSSSIQITFA